MMTYILPALVALLLKIYVVAIAQARKTRGVFLYMVLVFALHNFIEVVAYGMFAADNMPELMLRLYYISVLLMLWVMSKYSLKISRSNTFRGAFFLVTGMLIVGGLTSLFTDLIIAGVQEIAYSATAIRGKYYWLFTSLVLIGLAIVVVTLVHGYRTANEHLTQVQCLYFLAAITPFVLLGFFLVPAMFAGYKVNAAGLLPLCTTLFLLITLKGEAKHGLTDLRRFMPFSRERKTTVQVQEQISRFSMDTISFKELITNLEKIALKHKLDQADDSVSEAARLLKMKRTTLYSILERHDMK